jgi:putative hydrolase of the HAD superfamily
VSDVFEPFAKTLPAGLFDSIYEAFREPSAWFVFPDVRATLEELRRMKIRLAVASNWDERLPDLLGALGLEHSFERLFVSYFHGSVKPAPEFFSRAAATMKLAPEQILHVGDDTDEDFEGASAAGMRAVLVDRSRPTNPPNRISSLAELPRYISFTPS